MKVFDTNPNNHIPNPFGPWPYATDSARRIRRRQEALGRKAVKLAKRKPRAKPELTKP